MSGGGKGSTSTEVYEYYMSLLMGICWGPVDALRAVWFGETLLLGTNITGPKTINIYEPNFFGGNKKEGGAVGCFTFLPGTESQLLPNHMADRMYGTTPELSPGYRQICCVAITELRPADAGYPIPSAETLHFKDGTALADARTDGTSRGGWGPTTGENVGFSVAFNNPYMKAFWFEVARASKGIFPETMVIFREQEDHDLFALGDTDYLDIEGKFDTNIAHAIFEVMTNSDWGMGAPPWAFDLGSVKVAADTFFGERCGVSFHWREQMTIEALVQLLVDHGRIAIFPDPNTGLITFKVIRDNYVLADQPTFDASNSILSDVSARGVVDMVNEIIVKWTNPESNDEEATYFHDLASIADTGELVSETNDYKLFRRKDLADEAASRNVFTKTSNVRTGTLTVGPQADAIKPADVVRVNFPEDGFFNAPMRVGLVSYADDRSSNQVLSLVEDIFVAPYVASSGGAVGTAPSLGAIAIAHRRVVTMPYYFLMRAGITVEDGDEFFGVLAAGNNSTVYSIEVFRDVTQPDGSVVNQNVIDVTACRYGTLDYALAAEVMTPGFGIPSNLSQGITFGANAIAIIGPAGSEEICLVTTYVNQNSFTLMRGILDTVPRAWPVGTPIWIIPSQSVAFVDPESFAAGVSRTLGMVPVSFTAATPPAPVTTTYTLVSRAERPLRPAKVLVDGIGAIEATAAARLSVSGSVEVSWANRNRQTEDYKILRWDDSSITPEGGQTTVITLRNASGGVISSVDTTGTTATLDCGAYLGDASLTAYSSRDGLLSYQGIVAYLTIN